MLSKAADGGALAGAAATAIAAILGGAFFPGQRLVIGALLAIVLVWFGCQRRQPFLEFHEWALLALVGWGGASAALAGTAPLAAKEVVTGWLVAWCLWVAARRAGPRIAAMAVAILIATAGLVATGLALEAVGRGALRVGGLLENPNIAAALLVGSLPLLSVFWKGVRRGWVIAVALLLIGGVGLTGSRAGMLAILGAGAALLPRGRARVIGLVTGAGAIAAILVWRFVSQPDILAWFRPSIWQAVLLLWTAHPLVGVGPGGLVDAAGPVRLLHDDHVGQHQFLITYAESSPLGLAVQLGLVGCVIAAVAVVLWARHSQRAGAPTSAPWWALVIGMTVMAAFHDFVTIEIVLWWWALALGLIEASGGTSSGPYRRLPEHWWARTLRGLVLAFVVLWGVVQPAWARWLWRVEAKDAALVARANAAEPWFDRPLEWQVRSLLDQRVWTWQTAAEALAVANKAVRVHPGASRLWLILGQVQYRVITDFGPWPESVVDARAAFARAAELEPHLPWPWLEWARLERSLGNLDESVSLVRKALAAEPHAIRARLFLARVELDLGNVRLARQALEAARTSSALRTRAGLKPYEQELLSAPAWQFREIDEALQ